MYTYYFEDLETGENFFVECEEVSEAIDTAKTYFQRPRFLGIVSTEWAEIMGFDTYQKGVKKMFSKFCYWLLNHRVEWGDKVEGKFNKWLYNHIK